MKVFATFLLTLTLIMVSASNDNNQPTDEEEGWFVPDFDFNMAWVSKTTVTDEVKLLRLVQHEVKYYLFTRSNPKQGKLLKIDAKNLLDESYFNNSNPTSIVIHGFQNTYESPICTLVRDALLRRESTNVICVDWGNIASKLYPTATHALSFIGKDVSQFVYFVRLHAKLSFEKLTIIGHSLGAHAAGFAGKNLIPKVHHIIGCDPAMPLFSYDNCSSRLCKSDAKFVETIQTCGGKLGFFEPVGMAAYYPNGGKTQPGCGIDLIGSCAHSRSYIYVAEAIRMDDFPSRRCKYISDFLPQDCAKLNNSLRMASPVTYGVNGIFYVPVSETPKYGRG